MNPAMPEEPQNKGKIIKILVVVFGFVALTFLLTIQLNNLKTNSLDLTDKVSDLEIFEAAVAPNITLKLESDKSQLKQNEVAHVSLKTTSGVSANYKALAFASAITIPSDFTVSNKVFTNTNLNFSYSELVGNRLLIAGVNKSSNPFVLGNGQELYSFDLTLNSNTSGTADINLEVSSDGAYPAIVGSDLLEATITPVNLSITKNPNSAPVITSVSVSPSNPKIGETVAVTVVATDVDNNLDIANSTYSLTGASSASGKFVGSLSKSFDNLVVGDYAISVVVKDTAGLSATSSKTFTVTVSNTAPSNITLSPNTITESRPNKPAIGREVGTLSVTDPDAGQTHTYQLLSNTDTFEIVGNKLKTKSALDFETKPSYDLSIKVTDSKGASATETIKVTVTNILELDLTGDGNVVLRDELIYILDIMFGNIANPTSEMKEIADFDGNGKAEMADLIAWLNVSFGN